MVINHLMLDFSVELMLSICIWITSIFLFHHSHLLSMLICLLIPLMALLSKPLCLHGAYISSYMTTSWTYSSESSSRLLSGIHIWTFCLFNSQSLYYPSMFMFSQQWFSTTTCTSLFSLHLNANHLSMIALPFHNLDCMIFVIFLLDDHWWGRDWWLNLPRTYLFIK